ncbi:protein breast cancer susceptibility 1 homolog [Phtheirospermum japonicum]|uniref:Protein breast cancer susceptibility 1 homolog n=1 Tax=Phtheirospermum japonicum TaxID=374723 RepID=A0A830B7G4_9LAMI|nr:protein breast cancer susceptibility 1 homolog [Phtheirospermum japonicum]
MSEASRLLNPWVFHFQKLGLELKCPLCLCVPASSHFSTQCPSCQQHFTDQETRPAYYMENIIAMYKSLDSTFNSGLLPLLSTDSGNLASISISVDQTRKKLTVTAPKGQSHHADGLLINHVASGSESTKCPVSEELDVNHAPEMSPRSSPSSGNNAKGAEAQKSNPGSKRGLPLQGKEIHRVKKPVGDNLVTAAGEMDDKDAFQTREPKRQKKLDYGVSDAVLQKHGYCQQIISHADQDAGSNCNEEFKSKEETPLIPSIAPCDASYVNGSACAFCHSSKITEGTGPLLHYANGKEVARGETVSSKAIPVHSKCIEWTPQVYYVGETIKNLESELARASKLKCSRCGLKGAALGCFAKSCRRSYHVPCAVETPGCRWDCDAFVMLCPAHKSIKFPSEKSKSRKRHTEQKCEQKCSVPIQIASEQLNFWSNSLNGPQEWVLCGSALSSQDKCLLVKFATMCGATVFKFWNPNVTHVIASTDSDGACSRTLKVLMAILNGRWILTMDWIKACVEANHYVDEEPYEVNLDNHGCCDGAKTGRLRASNNAPKLFHGLSFYFNGDFVPSYKNDLLELVRVGGGDIIESMEHITEQKHNQQPISTTYVVYNHDYPQGCTTAKETIVFERLAEAEDVAKDVNARVIPHTWILESIAACRVLPIPLR